MISMVGYDMEPDMVRRKVDGGWIDAETKPSIEAIRRDPIHRTVVLIPREGFGVNRIYTDENDLTRRIAAVIERYRALLPGSRTPENRYLMLAVRWNRDPEDPGSPARPIGQHSRLRISPERWHGIDAVRIPSSSHPDAIDAHPGRKMEIGTESRKR